MLLAIMYTKPVSSLAASTTCESASARPDATPELARRDLLVINSNTSTAITALLQKQAQDQAGPQIRTRAVTARFGAPYIADEVSYAIAAHATLDAWAAALSNEQPAPDGVLIGCFGDPGLEALRMCSPVPVTGLAEASFIAAARLGRFAIVTGGRAWEPILRRLALTSGFGEQIASVHAVELQGDQLAADRPRALSLLTQACNDVIARQGVQSVILGGAGVAGIAAEIQRDVAIPMIDSVQAGVSWALEQCHRPSRSVAPETVVAWQGLSVELMRLGRASR